MKEKYPNAEIIGGLDDQVLACTKPVTDGDTFSIHGINIQCLHTPCHTRGHILYYCQADETDTSIREEGSDFEISKDLDGKY